MSEVPLYYKVDMLGVRNTSVNFFASRSTESLAPKDRGGARPCR